MTLTISLLAREVFSFTIGRNTPHVVEREPDDGQDGSAGSGHNFGFAAPQPRDIDYPESRWDATRYGHVEAAA